MCWLVCEGSVVHEEIGFPSILVFFVHFHNAALPSDFPSRTLLCRRELDDQESNNITTTGN